MGLVSSTLVVGEMVYATEIEIFVHISERAPVSLAEERAVFDVPNNNLNLRIQYIKRHCVNMGGSPAV